MSYEINCLKVGDMEIVTYSKLIVGKVGDMESVT